MAAFELSPAFFLNGDTKFSFLLAVAMITLVTVALWFFNIYILMALEQKADASRWKRYFLSYLFAFFTIAAFILLAETVHPKDREVPSPLFPFINASALNTIILIIINSIVNRSKKEQLDRELSILKIKNLEAEQQQLIQQLQPHFLFNTLSTLKSLINTNPEQAEEYLVKLSDFLRFTVFSSGNRIVSLNEELKFTDDYIKLQQIRFSQSFQCEITIPQNIRQAYQLPVYALQTLVENAIKHNGFTEAKPLKLSIVFKDGRIDVRNNKIPKPAEIRSGIGLENLNKRFTLIGGEKIKIVNEPDYFLVSMTLIPKA
jgi:Putative regulator of cell autolysis